MFRRNREHLNVCITGTVNIDFNERLPDGTKQQLCWNRYLILWGDVYVNGILLLFTREGVDQVLVRHTPVQDVIRWPYTIFEWVDMIHKMTCKQQWLCSRNQARALCPENPFSLAHVLYKVSIVFPKREYTGEKEENAFEYLWIK